MAAVWEALRQPNKKWKIIFKVWPRWWRRGSGSALTAPARQGLTLLDHLVKHGSERVVEDARDHMYNIRTLTDFSYRVEGTEKGAGGACVCVCVCVNVCVCVCVHAADELTLPQCASAPAPWLSFWETTTVFGRSARRLAACAAASWARATTA